MDTQDQARQDVERIMRRAAEIGLDPKRVARALDHRPPPPVEFQPVVELESRAGFTARATQRSSAIRD